MIIFLILISLFVLLTALFVLFLVLHNNTRGDFSTPITITIGVIIAIAAILFSIGLVATLNSLPKNYILLKQEREDLVYTYNITKESGIANNNGVIKQILEYNAEIREYKYMANSPWLNWFVNRGLVEELELIELGE